MVNVTGAGILAADVQGSRNDNAVGHGLTSIWVSILGRHSIVGLAHDTAGNPEGGGNGPDNRLDVSTGRSTLADLEPRTLATLSTCGPTSYLTDYWTYTKSYNCIPASRIAIWTNINAINYTDAGQHLSGRRAER